MKHIYISKINNLIKPIPRRTNFDLNYEFQPWDTILDLSPILRNLGADPAASITTGISECVSSLIYSSKEIKSIN